MNVIINMICTTNIEFTFARKAGVQQMFSLFRSTSVYWNPPSFTWCSPKISVMCSQYQLFILAKNISLTLHTYSTVFKQDISLHSVASFWIGNIIISLNDITAALGIKVSKQAKKGVWTCKRNSNICKCFFFKYKVLKFNKQCVYAQKRMATVGSVAVVLFIVRNTRYERVIPLHSH